MIRIFMRVLLLEVLLYWYSMNGGVAEAATGPVPVGTSNQTQPCVLFETYLRGSLNVPNRVFWAVRTTISAPRPQCASLAISRRFGPPEDSLPENDFFCYSMLLMYIFNIQDHREEDTEMF